MTKKYLIALDDGHGMETAGKRTPPLENDLYINGQLVRKKGSIIHENEFNRAVVVYLSEALKRSGFDVLLVAPGDSDVPLATRVKSANDANADAYVSKHYNSIGEKWQTKAKGLVTIIHYNHLQMSKVLATNVHEELWQLHKEHDCINYGVRTDMDVSGFSLYVLRNTKMPAILTESGFMDNMLEASKMLDQKFQKSDAEATCKGICKTFGVNYIEPNDSENLENADAKYVKVIVDELNIRSSPSWSDDAISGIVKKGEVFTIVRKIDVDANPMYELKSGVYITASTNYVQVLNNI